MDLGVRVDSFKAEASYLDLLKKCLTRYIFNETYARVNVPVTIKRHKLFWGFYPTLRKILARYDLELVRRVRFDPALRAEGKDWPADGETMVGLKRLDNLEYCITEVIERKIPGDLIETGVWRGGASIFMRAVLKVYQDTERVVWLADSFQGLPKPDTVRYPQDKGDIHWEYNPIVAVSLDEVKTNFARYGLLDDQVRFLVGWFKDSLPKAPVDRLAILRLDGDMYSSTMDVLKNLYSKLSVGGYAIIDDYGVVPACKQAVEDFRAENGITEEIIRIDGSGVFWRRCR